jgi:hypothetical protein
MFFIQVFGKMPVGEAVFPKTKGVSPKVQIHIWRSYKEIVTGNPRPLYMFRSLFLEGTQWG